MLHSSRWKKEIQPLLSELVEKKFKISWMQTRCAPVITNPPNKPTPKSKKL
jgi:hypothetical protein